MLSAVVVVVFALLAGLALGSLATAQRHAAWAADAAALAGAQVTLEGPGPACARAAALAARNGGRLSSCLVTDASVTVSVQVALPGRLARFGSATGRARAGPAAPKE
jgi:secretion/DNA translocation related TadE-like protein